MNWVNHRNRVPYDPQFTFTTMSVSMTTHVIRSSFPSNIDIAQFQHLFRMAKKWCTERHVGDGHKDLVKLKCNDLSITPLIFRCPAVALVQCCWGHPYRRLLHLGVWGLRWEGSQRSLWIWLLLQTRDRHETKCKWNDCLHFQFKSLLGHMIYKDLGTTNRNNSEHICLTSAHWIISNVSW